MTVNAAFILSFIILFSARAKTANQGGIAVAADRAGTPAGASAPTQFPICHRPSDFTQAKEVTAYENCYAARGHFCDTHEKLKECVQLRHELSLIKAEKKVKDSDPAERCMIQKDGSYACRQYAIKFLSLDPQAVAPEPAAGTQPISPGLSMPDMKMPGGAKSGGARTGTTPNSPNIPSPQPTLAPPTNSDGSSNSEEPPPIQQMPIPGR